MEDESISRSTSTDSLVIKLKWKAQLNNHKESKGIEWRTDETSAVDKCLPICLTFPGEFAKHKNVNFHACEIRDSDEDISIISSRKAGIRAEACCLSRLNESAPAFDESLSLEDRSKYGAEDGDIGSSNIHTTSCKHNRKNINGYASCLKSFKYCYSRRQKQVCEGNGLSREIISAVSFPVKSSILHSSTVC